MYGRLSGTWLSVRIATRRARSSMNCPSSKWRVAPETADSRVTLSPFSHLRPLRRAPILTRCVFGGEEMGRRRVGAAHQYANTLFDTDVRLLDQLRPLGDFGFEENAKLLRRVAAGDQALSGH